VATEVLKSSGTQRSEHSARNLTLARWFVVGVGAAYLVTQLTLIHVNRAPGWDESIYLSQVTPAVKAVFFQAARARGTPLLVAPVTLSGGSIEAVRLFLIATSTVVTTAVFLVWTPLIELAAPVAAFAFCFTWVALYNGSEAMPNFWSGILGLGAAGLIARRLEGGRARTAVLAAAALVLMGLFRPLDATVAGAAIAAYVLLFRRDRVRVLIPLAGGLVAGWLPWLLEMSIRFGGPLDAFREAGRAHVASASIAQNVHAHLAYTDGRPANGAIPAAGVAWWVLVAALAVVALLLTRLERERRAAALAAFGLAGGAVEYFAFVSVHSPRFLLPAYAFASILVGLGVVTLLRRPGIGRVAGVLAVALFIPWAVWQGAVGRRYEELKSRSNTAFHADGLAIRRLAGDRSCAFLSPHGYPEIQLASACDGAILSGGPPTMASIDRARAGYDELFVFLPTRAPRSSPLRSFPVNQVPGPGRSWFVYRT
jgi:hypothetical protein